MRRMINYTGYFRISRYGKYLLSFTNILGAKPSQDLLFVVYDFDVKLRNLLLITVKRLKSNLKVIYQMQYL